MKRADSQDLASAVRGKLMIGQTVSHYKIVDKLGGGGMGVVYKAEDTKLGRFVALKFLPAEVAEDKQALERFLIEARAAASLSHPHICTIHEIDEHDGVPFIAMEYIDGKNLKVALSGQPMAIDLVIDLGIQIAEALAVAHAKGIIHRDIKPSNIYLTEHGQAKVLDFGLAKLGPQFKNISEDETVAADAPTQTRDLTSAGTAVGTVAYMSPEQALGQEVDARSDLFSLGALIYEMLTGLQAFAGPTQAAIFDKILNRVPPSPLRLGVEIPYDLEQVLNKAMEKDKVLRYQTALEFHTDLKRLRRDMESGRSGAATAASGSVAAAVADSGAFAAAVPQMVEEASASEIVLAHAARSRRWMWVFGGLLVAAIAVIAVLLWPEAEVVTTLDESDVILLTDFVNTTGDPVFDDTLRQALAVKLEESPFLNVFPERQILETLQYMGRPADQHLTVEIGQEICERQGIKALITGEIAPLGSNYVVTLTAQECLTGRALARDQTEAASKEEVLSVVGQSATKMRQELGESLASIEKFDAPVEQATTSSLEALRAFSLAMQTRAQGTDEDAVRLFRRAIEHDLDFAMAWARLGTVYGNLEESNAAAEATSEAFDLRDRVSEHERLYITSHYYGGVTGETEKEIESYELWKQTYPRDWTPWNNLSWLYYRMGQFEKAAEEGLQALNLEPDHPLPYTNVGRAYLNLYRLDDARTIFDGALAKGYVYYSVITGRYEVAYLQGDEEAMAQQVQALAGKPGEARMRELQAGVAASQGRLSEARQLFQQAVDIAQRYNFGEQSAFLMTRAAAAEAVYGNFDRARDEAMRAIDVARNRDTLSVAAATLARVGATAQAEELIAEMEERFPKDTFIQAVWIPMARAAGEIERGRFSRAIEWLEAARPYERRYPWVIFMRGQAHLLAASAEQAAAEFQKVIDLKGVVSTDPIHTIAYLGLARAHSLAGSVGASRKAYAVFFALLENADEGLPLIDEATAELAAL
jgi:tetratricopeptide (TPR) repeat protein/tRNA A-37 threonylcarbamoyl transferase component Bud32